ncbi:hypothetical protein H6G27_10290 [Nostoc linckia FACHB-104]|nr:hypothetical protein [Nostoc linckia FACHB-104]
MSLLIESYELLYLWRSAAYAMVRRRRDSSRLYKVGDRFHIYRQVLRLILCA